MSLLFKLVGFIIAGVAFVYVLQFVLVGLFTAGLFVFGGIASFWAHLVSPKSETKSETK